MPKSTPGPWRARNCQTAVLVDTIRNGDAMLIALVADNDSQGDTDTERKMNNARLIAAAPQMLEALELLSEAVRSLDEQISTVHDKIVITDAVSLLRLQNDALSAVKQAEAAIAAAKGEV